MTDFLTRYAGLIAPGPNGCLIWQGQRQKSGYGYIDLYEHGDGTRRRALAHRLAMGEPKGRVVRHLCHNPSCVNPEHLALGSQADNADDMVQADRSTSRIPFRHVGPIRHCIAAGVAATTMARLAGVSPTAIKRLARGETFRSAPGPICQDRDRGEGHLNARLTEEAVRTIRARVAAGDRQADVARDYAVTPQAINRIIKNKAWRHVQ